jgi:hypothetical protein
LNLVATQIKQTNVLELLIIIRVNMISCLIF